jgi:hypothetical protein
MKRRLAFWLLLLGGFQAAADHLPEKLLARGKPETVLAGVDLRTATPAAVLRQFGPPTRTIRVPNNPGWTGYLWDKEGVRLEIEVSQGKRGDYIDTVTVVRLGNATRPESPPATGAGLRLGDSLDRLKQLYGDRLQMLRQAPVPVSTGPFELTPGSQIAVLQWSSLEFTLTAGLDAEGKVVALRLRPPECYPGGCR